MEPRIIILVNRGREDKRQIQAPLCFNLDFSFYLETELKDEANTDYWSNLQSP